MIQPKHSVARQEVTPRDIVLLLDISGSMEGTPISQLRVFSEYILGTLNPQDRFNIIAFNNDLNTFSSQYLPATPENISNGQSIYAQNSHNAPTLAQAEGRPQVAAPPASASSPNRPNSGGSRGFGGGGGGSVGDGINLRGDGYRRREVSISTQEDKRVCHECRSGQSHFEPI